MTNTCSTWVTFSRLSLPISHVFRLVRFFQYEIPHLPGSEVANLSEVKKKTLTEGSATIMHKLAIQGRGLIRNKFCTKTEEYMISQWYQAPGNMKDTCEIYITWCTDLIDMYTYIYIYINKYCTSAYIYMYNVYILNRYHISFQMGCIHVPNVPLHQTPLPRLPDWQFIITPIPFLGGKCHSQLSRTTTQPQSTLVKMRQEIVMRQKETENSHKRHH